MITCNKSSQMGARFEAGRGGVVVGIILEWKVGKL